VKNGTRFPPNWPGRGPRRRILEDDQHERRQLRDRQDVVPLPAALNPDEFVTRMIAMEDGFKTACQVVDSRVERQEYWVKATGTDGEEKPLREQETPPDEVNPGNGPATAFT